MNFKHCANMLKVHEGFRSHPYRCTAGKLTIGYGRNIDDVGISSEEAEIMLVNDIAVAAKEVNKRFAFFADMTENRQAAIVDLVFNMGISKFRQFKKTIAALEVGDYNAASDELLDSNYARQVGSRAITIAYIIRSNELPPFAK